MADTATRYDLSILGVSIQYMHEGQLKIRTIGMKNLTEPQTALHLKDVILDRLQMYGINKHQLISFTTDNANSMTAMVNLMNDHPATDIGVVDNDDDESGDDEHDEDDDDIEHDSKLAEEPSSNSPFDMITPGVDGVQEFSGASESESDDEERHNEVDDILNENRELDQLLKELQRCFSADTMNINGIRCAAHTIQLAVQDALAGKKFKALIQKCKKVC